MDDTRSTLGSPQDIKPEEGPDFDSLSARKQDLQKQIAQLQDFVEHGPERERLAMEDEMRTLPPPVEIVERKREKEFMDKLSRGELKNEKRNQAKSGFLLFLLIIATLALSLWIYQAVQ
ncbi:MAG: hypothetical protein QNL01_05375 [Akkermansiaceae bacterium]|jgi:hypothetical protein|tara:strand:+ start:2236 stop:2592 length:357 start_codon:yes stop_codon:yes gene_type:complete